MKDNLIFIHHIKQSIDIIEVYTKEVSREVFEKDIKLQDAVMRRIEIIGEAAKNLPSNFKEKYKDVRWKEIVGMRDKLTHHYFGIDIELVWKTVKEDVPELKRQIELIIKEK